MTQGSIVTLGPLEREHLTRWRTWINDPEIAMYVDRALPVTEAEHERFFERNVVDNHAAVWFSINLNEGARYVGNVWLWNLHERNRTAELRIIIGERTSWGTGVGSEAIELLADFAFRQLGLHKLFAYVMERNPRARRAFEKSGFALEATLVREAYWDGTFSDVWRLARFA